jgi:hypothetical protein
LSHLKFFGQSESFVEFFQLNPLKIYLAPLPHRLFGSYFGSCSWASRLKWKAAQISKRKAILANVFSISTVDEKARAAQREKKRKKWGE